MLTQVLQVQEIKKSLLALNFLIKSVWRALMAPRRPSLNFHQISTVWSIPDSLSCTKKILALHLTGTWQKMTTTDWYRGLKIRVRGDFFFFFFLPFGSVSLAPQLLQAELQSHKSTPSTSLHWFPWAEADRKRRKGSGKLQIFTSVLDGTHKQILHVPVAPKQSKPESKQTSLGGKPRV